VNQYLHISRAPIPNLSSFTNQHPSIWPPLFILCSI